MLTVDAFKGYDIDGDGFISRDELHKVFKAYFNLSMELVRDVVKTMEEGLIESFDDEAAKPVSSAFHAPIPDTGDNEDTEEDSPGAFARKKNKPKFKKNEDYTGAILLEGLRTTAKKSTNTVSPSTNTIGNASRNFKRPLAIVANNNNSATSSQAQTPVSPQVSPINGAIEQIRTFPCILILGTTPFVLDSLASPTFSVGTPIPNVQDDVEHYPIMEAMSQDAIEEMVNKIFTSIKPVNSDKLTFDEFRKVVEGDSNLLAWFEALGSVF
jgi:hypothetical protein